MVIIGNSPIALLIIMVIKSHDRPLLNHLTFQKTSKFTFDDILTSRMIISYLVLSMHKWVYWLYAQLVFPKFYGRKEKKTSSHHPIHKKKQHIFPVN